MQLKCYRCNTSFSLGAEEILFALEALEKSQGKHYDARCPRCRHTNRVSIEQLRRAAPSTRPADQEEEGETAEP